MSAERPHIESIGTIVNVRETGRLFDIEMENGYQAIAVVPKECSTNPAEDPIGQSAKVVFSPYDMSRCKVLEWL